MKLNFRYFILGILFLYSQSITAQTVEKVILKNGSVIEGYLAEQRPGVSISVFSTNATLYANEDSLVSVNQEYVALSSLSKSWNNWAVANKLVNSDNTLLLSTIKFNNSTVSNVFVQERGITIRFVDLNERMYVFPWNQLSMTSKLLRPDNQFSGIIDELILADERHFEGQVTDQTPGTGIKIILKDGQVNSFNYSDILQIISKPLNSQMTIWEQSQLLDEVILKKTLESVQGVITSRKIGKDYTFLLKSGQTRVVNASDIAVFKKNKNNDYKSAIDRIMSEGEILINGDAKNAYFFYLQTTETCVVLDAEKASLQMQCGDTVVVEANLGNPNAVITVAKATVKEVEFENEKGKKVKKQKPVVTLVDLLQSKAIGTREVTPLGHIKFTLPITESGDYVMQIQGKEGYIVIYVPQKDSPK